MARQTGIADLWLVGGSVPHYREMVKLAKTITEVFVNEHGAYEFIKRISNPLWFSCYACILGFEWNTSGQTTVTLKALKDALSKENIGIKILGGKGLAGRKISQELAATGEEFNLSTARIEDLNYASRISAKVDSSALQDLSGQIYCHNVAVDEKGNWSVIQQKMDTEEQIARRYHWLCDLKSFIEEPHSGIIGSKKQNLVLDLTSKKSSETRKSVADMVNDTAPEKLQTYLVTVQKSKKQKRLLEFVRSTQKVKVINLPNYLSIPNRFNLKILNQIHQAKISGFEELLATKGVGPSTIRGLAFVSDLIYGTESSWKDPMKYSFAYGTKSGSPWFVQKDEMRKSAEILKQAVEESKLGRKEKLNAIARLKDFLR
jgi:hypothetical protein